MIEPKPPRPWLGAGEGRLYVAIALAGVYLLAFCAIPTPPPRRSDVPAPDAVPPARPAVAVWLDDLPADARPEVALPPGWRVASRGELSAAPAGTERVARAPARRRYRIRTRSS